MNMFQATKLCYKHKQRSLQNVLKQRLHQKKNKEINEKKSTLSKKHSIKF